MAVGKVNVGGASPIKGIVDDFIVSGVDIKAGNFVSFVDTLKLNQNTTSAFAYAYGGIRCHKLSSNKVLVYCVDGNSYVAAAIVTISDSTIEIGSYNYIHTTGVSSGGIRYIPKTSGAGYFIYSASGYVNSAEVTITGNSITVVDTTKLILGYLGDACLISGSIAAITYATSTNIQVAKIDLSNKTKPVMNYDVVHTSIGNVHQIVKLTSDKFAVVFFASGSSLYCKVVTIHENNTITVNSSYVPGSYSLARGIVIGDKFVLFSYSNMNGLSVMLFRISAGLTHISTTYDLSSGTITGLDFTVNTANKLELIYYIHSDSSINRCIVHITDASAILSANTRIRGSVSTCSWLNLIRLADGVYFTAGLINSYVTMSSYLYDLKICLATNPVGICGVAKQGGSSGKKIKITTL